MEIEKNFNFLSLIFISLIPGIIMFSTRNYYPEGYWSNNFLFLVIPVLLVLFVLNSYFFGFESKEKYMKAILIYVLILILNFLCLILLIVI
jgi:hypothetical protein